jgi:predicted RecB family nuclease
MSKPIDSEILIAYSQCPRKAFLLLCTNTQGTPHEYTEILEKQRQTNQRKFLDILQRKNVDVQPYNLENLKGKHEFLINVTLEANGLAAKCAILNKIRTHSSLGRYSYEPTIFVSTHSIKKEQKLELFFVSHVLEQVQDKRPVSGRIIGLDEKSHKVKLENGPKTLIPFLEPLQEWAGTFSPEPPPLILNKHCSICQFQSLCQTKAKQEDNLSLLDGVSTPKAINKYEKKGIFTVKQLSYTFKPRKRKKRAKNPPPVAHKPELQALAIHEGKIYLQELPALTRQPVELFLDIEGVPDQSFYYLMGLLVSQNETITYYPFWADIAADEAEMWRQFIAKVNQYPTVPIYHYGSFDSRTLTTLTKRYNTDADSITSRLINVNKHVFGKVYFPTYSNRLKEIGDFIGVKWSSPQASGLQSLVWRHHWEETRSAEYKNLLLTYNEEDCLALKLLTDELSRIKHSADTLNEVDFANQPKRHTTEVGEKIHSQFETILKFAHTNYDKKKISFRQDKSKDDTGQKQRPSKKGYQGQRKVSPKPTRLIRVLRENVCPECGNGTFRPVEQESKRLIIDLVLTRNGIRKTITEYVGLQGYCPKCRRYYPPSAIRKYSTRQLYGHGFKSFAVYQRVALRMTYASIAEVLAEQFNEQEPKHYISAFIKDLGNYYVDTERGIIQRLLESPFIHADETPVNIRGINQYVWVFTDGKYVVFKLRNTREATIVHEFLANYNGVLVSDFYPGYDSAQCKQQKCWSHLIRDLNNDLWANPFDIEYEAFLLEVRNLIIQIMEAVQKYGLKKRNLNKFKKLVDKFYIRVIIDRRYKSELVLKYQNRFTKYRDSLFTFLEEDGIPWHNNTAENAIRHLAIQRDMSKSFYETGTRAYLVLLGIRQTCRYQGKSFFKFLFSGEIDLDKFEANKRK